MTTVLATGVFDYLHPGHRFYLQSARKLGDRLVVVIARDENVRMGKGFLPKHSEVERKRLVEASGIPDQVILGKQGSNYLEIIREICPHILAVGYDQRIPSRFADEFPYIKIVKIPGKNTGQWKSSRYRENSNSQK